MGAKSLAHFREANQGLFRSWQARFSVAEVVTDFLAFGAQVCWLLPHNFVALLGGAFPGQKPAPLKPETPSSESVNQTIHSYRAQTVQLYFCSRQARS